MRLRANLQSDPAAASQPRKRVLFLCPVPNFKGGAERSLMDLVANPDIDPVVAVPEDGPVSEYLRQRSVEVRVFDMKGVANIHRPFKLAHGMRYCRDAVSAARELVAMARSCDASLIHSNGLKTHGLAMLARRLGGPAIALHIRDIPLTRSETAFWQAMRLSADRLLIVSRACWPGEDLPPKVRVVHNGTEPLPPLYQPIEKGQPITVGYIGRLHPSKGVHSLISWVARARRTGFDVHLSIRGAVDPVASGYEDTLRGRASHLGISEAVTFEGFLQGPESIYGGLNIVVVPSEVPDPLPRSVMEAMSAGLVVMGYPAGGIPEMIDHGVNGYLIRNAELFVAALMELTDNPGLAAEMSAAATKKMRDEFSPTALHRCVNAIYGELAD